MQQTQTGILDPVPPLSRYLFFGLSTPAEVRPALRALRELADGQRLVVGLGQSLVLSLDRHIEGLRLLPQLSGPGTDVPSTPQALWCWLRGEDRGELLHRGQRVQQALAPALRLNQVVDGFRYGSGRDLSGYEDGTENPKDEAAHAAALVAGQGPGRDGASFVAVQQWLHDWQAFEAMSPEQQDLSIGRRRSDNVEIEDAPASAHVKRTAQEDFSPEAFVLRRSMPWAEAMHSGLMFVAFGKSFDAFEAQLRRMSGSEDGIADALFGFTRPISGGYFWCPPMHEGQLDLSILGL